MFEIAAAASSFVHVETRPELTLHPVSSLYYCKDLKFVAAIPFGVKNGIRWKIRAAALAAESLNRIDEPSLLRDELQGRKRGKTMTASKKRVFFLDVNPLCYEGSTPSLRSFGIWISLFFSQVSHSDPVIAVIDGEGGSEHRQQILPSYKAHRKKFSRYVSTSRRAYVGRSSQVIKDVLRKCNVPVIQIEGQEADDVVATLTSQVVQKGYRVVVASPDKDFKQLISEHVQIVMPVPELGRWSFYTLKHYFAQYNCDPCSDLSLRCILGDEVDGVPGIQHLAPEFGRKTAVKLMKKHGSLENLLSAAAVRTVGKPYAQDALTKHGDYLRRNYEVLALRRDVDVLVQEELLVERNTCNDSATLANLFKMLEDREQLLPHGKRSHSLDGLLSKKVKALTSLS